MANSRASALEQLNRGFGGSLRASMVKAQRLRELLSVQSDYAKNDFVSDWQALLDCFSRDVKDWASPYVKAHRNSGRPSSDAISSMYSVLNTEFSMRWLDAPLGSKVQVASWIQSVVQLRPRREYEPRATSHEIVTSVNKLNQITILPRGVVWEYLDPADAQRALKVLSQRARSEVGAALERAVLRAEAELGLNKRRTPRPQPSRQQTREKLMRLVLATRKTGLDYCREMERLKVPPLEVWHARGWPGSYTKAYLDPEWRKKIQDDKSRHATKFAKENSLE